MSPAQEAWLDKSHQATKKDLLRTGPRTANPGVILPRTSSKDALRQLQNKRLKQQSRLIADSADWLMWMFPTNAGSFVHRLVDRLMEGDTKAEQHVQSVRQELGL